LLGTGRFILRGRGMIPLGKTLTGRIPSFAKFFFFLAFHLNLGFCHRNGTYVLVQYLYHLQKVTSKKLNTRKTYVIILVITKTKMYKLGVTLKYIPRQ
jgi:hypothetical protein